jgi:pimeloyl-ACP methyl ester carboxylesterase
MKQTMSFLLFLLAFHFSFNSLIAQEPVASNGKFIKVNGATIYYEEQGTGDPLILMHGFGRTSADWKPFVAEYAKYYRVISWDMRGHGRSDNPDTSEVFLHAVAARDLLALIDALQLKNVKLIGHSSGGIVALYAAIMKPDAIEAIVPVSAQIYYSEEVRDFIKRNAMPELSYDLMGFEKLHGKKKGLLLARQFYHFSVLQGDPLISHEQLSKIKARALVIHGDNDFVPVLQAWEIFQYIPGAHLSVIPNGWHIPHEGEANSKLFLRQTLEFLRGDWEKSSFQK